MRRINLWLAEFVRVAHRIANHLDAVIAGHVHDVPLGRAQATAFLKARSGKTEDQSVLSRLNYVWEELMAGSSEMTLPQFEGIAVFAVRLRESPEYMESHKINTLIVCTPLCVRQT